MAKPSEDAMRLAKQIVADFPERYEDRIFFIATLIDREVGGWIKCSERMPTLEDGDEQGRVLWTTGKQRINEPWSTNAKYFTHWMRNSPLPPPPEES